MKYTIVLLVAQILLHYCNCQYSECLNRKSNEIGFQNYGHLMNKIFEADRKYYSFLKKALNFDYGQYQEKCRAVYEMGLLIRKQVDILVVCKEMCALEQHVLTQLEYSKNFCLFNDKERQAFFKRHSRQNCLRTIKNSECYNNSQDLCDADVEEAYLDCIMNKTDEKCHDHEKLAAFDYHRILLRFSKNHGKCRANHILVGQENFDEYYMKI